MTKDVVDQSAHTGIDVIWHTGYFCGQRRLNHLPWKMANKIASLCLLGVHGAQPFLMVYGAVPRLKFISLASGVSKRMQFMPS